MSRYSRFGYSPGDPIICRWPLLNNVPGKVGRVFSKGDIDAVFEPSVLEQHKVPREHTFVISNDGLVHVTLEPHEFEVFGKKIQVN